MRMSIDEAIEYNKNLKMYMEISDKQDTYKFLEENHVALDIAIAIMGKYRKIEQIVRADFEEYHPLDRNPYKLHLIKKVIEDEMN